MTRLARWLAACLLLLLASCASVTTTINVREASLTEYGAAIRLSDFDGALMFVDPALRQQQALSDFDRERLKQIQVTGYEVKSRSDADDGSIEQRVDIRLINKNTQIERVVTDNQRWRWDAASKRLWLSSGLPDFSAR